jgi:hypothetical protein
VFAGQAREEGKMLALSPDGEQRNKKRHGVSRAYFD